MKKISQYAAITAALMLGFSSQSALSGDFKQANYDLKGSRSIPAKKEKGLTIDKIAAAGGLEVKWFAPLPGTPGGVPFPNGIPVTGAPAVRKGVVYVGTISGPDKGRKGGVDARDAKTGAFKWHTEIPNGSGIVGTPLIHNGKLYVATFDGGIYLLKMKDGTIIASNKPVVSGPPIDGIFSSPIAVPTEGGSLIVFAINPADDNPANGFGQSAVIALDSETLAEKWRYVITQGNEGGSGIAHASPTYSAKFDLIFVGTGQSTNTNSGTTSATSDAIIALRAGANVAPGSRLAWISQVRNNDFWNFTKPFNPKNPLDTDVLDSPAVFKCATESGECVAAGSKRGIFYVMDAADGTILNGNGSDGTYARGLDAFYFSGNGINSTFSDKEYGGTEVVGDAIAGGYNLDSGYYRKDGNTIHFGTVLDATLPMQNVTTCYQQGFGPACPGPDRSHIVLISGDGLQQIGRYTMMDRFVYGAMYVNDMIFATAGKGFGTTPNSLLVVDVSNPASPLWLDEVKLQKDGISAVSGGSLLSISNCMIYMGTGFNQNSGGLYAIGLKGDAPCDKDDDDDDDDDD